MAAPVPQPAAPHIAPQGVKGWAWFALKFAISVGILAVALSRIHVDPKTLSLERINAPWCLAALALLAILIVVSGLRWSLLSRKFDAQIKPAEATGITFAALFVGQVLPSTLGVDAIRAWLASRAGMPFKQAIGSLVLDRACGTVGLGLLILLGAPRLAALGGVQISQNAALVALGMIVAGAAGVVALRLIARARFAGRLGHLQQIAHEVSRAIVSPEGAAALIISLCMQAGLVFSMILIARSLGIPLSVADGMATIPAAMLVATIPITINGWGLREGAMIACLALAHIASSDAFVISLLFGLGQLIVALPGAAYWVFARRRAPG